MARIPVNSSFVRLLSAAAILILAARSARADEVVRYDVTVDQASAPRQLLVSMQFTPPENAAEITLQLPVWAPGDYHVQELGPHVRNFAASAGSQSLHFAHTGNSTWTVTIQDTAPVTVRYAVPPLPPGFFSENVQLTPTQVYVNGPAALMYVVGAKSRPASLTWHVSTGWTSESGLPGDRRQSGDAITGDAPDYDTLADSPLVMTPKGGMLRRDFMAAGTHFWCVYFGDTGAVRSPDVYTPMLERLARAESKIMGGMPTKEYRFLFDVNGGGGGLEHLNCCRIALPAGVPPERFADFVAHELFHLWNVKRIRPITLGPFDYAHPPVTRNLWFAEGVTQYYADIACRRAGIDSAQQMEARFARAISRMQRNPKRLEVTADESSLRVWEAGNSDGYGISYYSKGELIGLCLDLAIRHATDGRKSLDDVMRSMMERYGLPKPGYPEDGIREVLSETAGTDLAPLYNRLARSAAELPIAECLAYAGLTYAPAEITLKPLPSASPSAILVRRAWEQNWEEPSR